MRLPRGMIAACTAGLLLSGAMTCMADAAARPGPARGSRGVGVTLRQSSATGDYVVFRKKRVTLDTPEAPAPLRIVADYRDSGVVVVGLPRGDDRDDAVGMLSALFPARDFQELSCRRSKSGRWAVSADRVIVRFHDNISKGAIRNLLVDVDAIIVKQIAGPGNRYVVMPARPDDSGAELAARMGALPETLWAHEDLLRRNAKKYLPDDTDLGNQWYLHNVGQNGGMKNRDLGAERAWNITAGTSSVIIAVLDDGCDLAHLDLAANIFSNLLEGAAGVDGDGNGYTNDWRGWDFVDNDNDPSPALPDDNHGTTMAGLAAGVFNNGLGVAGLAGRCTILPIRAAGEISWDSDWVSAIAYAAGTADVLSISYYIEPTQAVLDAINDALMNGRNGLGCVICCALGNDGVLRRYSSDAAAAPEVLTIAGTSNFERRPWFSDYGPPLSFVCPGGGGSVDLISTDRSGAGLGYATNSDYFSVYGTSASCPLAAAGAALLVSQNPTWSGLEIRRQLEDTCDRIDSAAFPYNECGWNNTYGFGRMNAWAALSEPQQPWDPYEPDNDATLAGPIADGELQYRSLASTSDVDWASFTMAAGSVIELKIVGATNTFLRLYDAATNEVAQDQGYPSYSRLSTNVNPGTYYVSVESATCTIVPQYGLHLAVLQQVDSFEPDDATNSAKTLFPRSMQYRTLYPAGDEDWATFELTVTADLSITTMGEWDGWLELSLWDSNTNLLAEYWDPDTNVVANIYTSLNAGVYYIRVRDYEDRELTAYQLVLEPWASDEYEPDNDTNNAVELSRGIRLNHTIFPATDIDWYTFILSNKANVLIMTDTINPLLLPETTGDTFLELFGADVAQPPLASSDDDNNDFFSAFYKTDLDPGRYYVKVTGFGTNFACPDYYVALDIFEAQTAVENFNWSTSGISFAWDGDASYIYCVQYAGTLGGTQVWRNVTNLEGQVGRNTWTNEDGGPIPPAGGSTQRFYRILVE